MIRLFERFMTLAADDGFLRFQNQLTEGLYDSLTQGYTVNEGEVALVKRMVASLNGQSYSDIHIYTSMLHGTRSYVEFKHMDKPVTKELGDMAVITLVTSGNERLFQRLSIIQNKKERSGKWHIDTEQLYLLKNFPTLSGSKGIFRNCTDVIFRNYSGCLGSFGLLLSPGEMILASAPLVTEFLRDKNILDYSEIALITKQGFIASATESSAHFWPLATRFPPEDWFYLMEKFYHRFGFPYPTTYAGSGFLGNVHFTRDLYDFVRNWTQINLGEITFAHDRVLNQTADQFANRLIRKTNYKGDIKLSSENKFGDSEFEGNMGIFVMHIDVTKKK